MTGAVTEVLIERVARLLAPMADVSVSDSSSATVAYHGVRSAIQAMSLAEGLDVLAVTQVVAWDLPNTEALRDDVDRLTADLSFGSIKRASRDLTTDVLTHYTFPAGTLDDEALLTMLTLVLSRGVDLSRSLTD